MRIRGKSPRGNIRHINVSLMIVSRTRFVGCRDYRFITPFPSGNVPEIFFQKLVEPTFSVGVFHMVRTRLENPWSPPGFQGVEST